MMERLLGIVTRDFSSFYGLSVGLQAHMGHDVEKRTSQNTPCRFAELVQYDCHLERNSSGIPEAHCFPIPRIFKLQVQATWATISY